MSTINMMLRSTYWGQGKTVAAVSFKRPDTEPRRLVMDREYRAESYQGEADDRESLLFAFDLWRDVYGELTPNSLIKFYQDITSGEFEYNVVVFDNLTLFQEELYMLMGDVNAAKTVSKALGIYERHRLFLDYRFRSTDPGSYYPLLKSVIRAILLGLRRASVDVITTTESKNVWKAYGTKDARILGQTAKAWDPWFQFADVLLVLERLTGNRNEGTAKLTPYPTARLDTFNVKCSVPGIPPEFVLRDWDGFWSMVEKRVVPTKEDFDKLTVAQAEQPEDTPVETIKEAKRKLAELAIQHGLLKGMQNGVGAAALKAMGAEHGLDMDNALAEFAEWVSLIITESKKGKDDDSS